MHLPQCHAYGHQIVSAETSCLRKSLVFQCYIYENKIITARYQCFTRDTRDHEPSSGHYQGKSEPRDQEPSRVVDSQRQIGFGIWHRTEQPEQGIIHSKLKKYLN